MHADCQKQGRTLCRQPTAIAISKRFQRLFCVRDKINELQPNKVAKISKSFRIPLVYG